MKIIFSVLIIILLTSCGNEQRQKDYVDLPIIDSTKIANEDKSYTEQQLTFFLDSIGSFPPSYFAENVSFIADSIFRNQLQMNKVISQSNFSRLKLAINEEDEILRTIDIKTAKNIFGEIQVDSSFVADLLFINTHYNELKKGIKDKTKRHIVLNYLNGVKNYYEIK